MNQRWLCAQIGAREHYAIPRALHRISMLHRLYTDVWVGSASRYLKAVPGLTSLAGRSCDLPDHCVRSFNWATLGARLARNRRGAGSRYHQYLNIGCRFGERVRAALTRETFDPRQTRFFAYTTGALEPVSWLAERGMATVVGQIDAARVAADIVAEEARRWPGWSTEPEPIPDAYFARLEQEWRAADLVVVNSEWAKRALEQQGVPAGKLHVVPLAYEDWQPVACKQNRSQSPTPGRDWHAPRLTVLWLGQVTLLKGIAYLFAAARLLQKEAIDFLVVGPIGISALARRQCPSNVRLLGPVARSHAGSYFERAHLFVLPTLSDGFGITQLEAMAHGLPVVATPRCGEVVGDGVDGRLVPAADAAALGAAIAELASDRQRLADMSEAARRKASEFSLSRLARNLQSLFAPAEAALAIP